MSVNIPQPFGGTSAMAKSFYASTTSGQKKTSIFRDPRISQAGMKDDNDYMEEAASNRLKALKQAYLQRAIEQSNNKGTSSAVLDYEQTPWKIVDASLSGGARMRESTEFSPTVDNESHRRAKTQIGFINPTSAKRNQVQSQQRSRSQLKKETKVDAGDVSQSYETGAGIGTADVMQRFLSTQKQRLDSMRAHINTGREMNSESQTRQTWNETRVDEEIMLLRKARQMTKMSYQNRIRTGGSLVQKAKVQPGVGPQQQYNGIAIIDGCGIMNQLLIPTPPIQLSGQSQLDSDNTRFDAPDDLVILKHFKQLPKLTNKQSKKTSARLSMQGQHLRQHMDQISLSQIQSSRERDRSKGEHLIPPIKKAQSPSSPKQGQPPQQSKIKKKHDPLRLEIQRLNREEQESINRENIKDLVMALPVVLAQRPFDQLSEDFLFMQGCNMIHKKKYSEAYQLFKEATLDSDDPRMKEMLIFNKAYCLYKLNGQDLQCREIWEKTITEKDIYFKAMAEFNVAVIKFSYDLGAKGNQIRMKDLKKLHECFVHFDVTMQVVMKMGRYLADPHNTKAVQIPQWINYDSFVSSCKKLYLRMKILYDSIPVYSPTVDQSEVDYQVDADEKDKQAKRRWISRVVLQYGMFFKNYSALTTRTTSEMKQITQKILRPQTQMDSYLVRSFQGMSDFSQGIADDDTVADMPSSAVVMERLQQQRFQNNTPMLIISRDRDRLDFVPPLRFSKNFTSEGQNSQESLEMPFVMSKRPEEIIKNYRKQQVKVPKIPIYLENDYYDEPVQQQLTQHSREDDHTPSAAVTGDDLISPHRLGVFSQEFPMTSKALPVIMEDFTQGASDANARNRFYGKKTQDDRANESEDSYVQRVPKRGKVIPEGNFRHSRVASSLNPSSPIQNRTLSAGGQTLEVSKRTSLVSRVNSPKAANAVNYGELNIKDKAPQTSDFYQNPMKRDDYSLVPITANEKTITIDDTIYGGLTKGSQPGGKTSLVKFEEGPVEIDEEFKGALITKEGNLYDDEEYDETYKKRLRLREVELIKEYIRQVNSGRVPSRSILEEDPEETIESVSPRTAMPFSDIDKFLVKLRFFNKYPECIRKQLIQGCRCDQLKVYQTGDTIFSQGEDSPQFFVILRGSTKAILLKKEYGFIPFVVNTFYDGREFGEVTLYQESEKLTAAMVSELNKQKYTCEAMELTYVLCLDKIITTHIINEGLQATFEERISFLSQIDIFKGIDMHVLLPLANNLEVKRYKIGEYILKEGRAPKGLFIITKGQCKVGSEQINMRSKDIFPIGRLKSKLRNFKFKGNFHDMDGKINMFDDDGYQQNGENERIDTKESEEDPENHSVALEVQRIFKENRVFQNDRIHYDEMGNKIKNHIVYKDFMTFFTLTTRDYFGGRVLLLRNDLHNPPQNNGGYTTLLSEGEHSAQPSPSTSPSRRNAEVEDSGTLAVIADSAEVELLMMERSQMSFFPENVQKDIYARIEKAFQPECPFGPRIIERVKDKFNEWERFKLETVGTILRQAYTDRRKQQILNLNR